MDDPHDSTNIYLARHEERLVEARLDAAGYNKSDWWIWALIVLACIGTFSLGAAAVISIYYLLAG